eukprot:878800-Amphidinium_carterae.1
MYTSRGGLSARHRHTRAIRRAAGLATRPKVSEWQRPFASKADVPQNTMGFVLIVVKIPCWDKPQNPPKIEMKTNRGKLRFPQLYCANCHHWALFWKGFRLHSNRASGLSCTIWTRPVGCGVACQDIYSWLV